ncbi:hypothetical protein Tco_0740041 [Tanacetum coccineum]
MQSPFPQREPKDSSQTEREHIKKDKGKKAMSSEDAEEESIESREHVHLPKEQISAQKKIEEEAKAEATRREGEIRNGRINIETDVSLLEGFNQGGRKRLLYVKRNKAILRAENATFKVGIEVQQLPSMGPYS